MMRLQLSLVTLLMLSNAAAAQPQERHGATTAAPLRIVIPIVGPKCDPRQPNDGSIVVCGRRDDRYRIDPTVLAAIRSSDSRGGRRPDPHTTMFNDRCSPVGLARCAGQNVVPVTSILMVALTAVDKIVRGEDLRPMLHTVPDEYALYKDAKATPDAKDSPAAH